MLPSEMIAGARAELMKLLVLEAAVESVRLLQLNPRTGETRIFPASAVGAT